MNTVFEFTDYEGISFADSANAWAYYLKKNRPNLFTDIPEDRHYLEAYCYIDKDRTAFKRIADDNSKIFAFQQTRKEIQAFMKKGDMDKVLYLHHTESIHLNQIPEGIKHIQASHSKFYDIPRNLPNSLESLDLTSCSIKQITWLPPNLKKLNLLGVSDLLSIDCPTESITIEKALSSLEKIK